MGLLPEKEIVDLSWGGAACVKRETLSLSATHIGSYVVAARTRGISHLGPASTGVPPLLDLGAGQGGREESIVYVGYAVEDIPVIPQRPVRGVPEEHLHVELAVLKEIWSERRATRVGFAEDSVPDRC